MKRSSLSDNSSVFGRWDEDDSNHPPHKKPKHSQTVTDDDANSLIISSNTPVSYRWVVTCNLGENSYGSVYLAVSTDEGHRDSLPPEMVIKSSEISNSSRLKNEEKFLTRLKNPYVVSCYGHEITEDERSTKYYNTILEYCPQQTLAKQLVRGKGLAEEDVKGFALDILLGLRYTHEEKIIHCDIKPKNILLLPVNTRIRASGFTAKISGFGKAMDAKSIEYGEGWGHRRGTTRFMSPELVGEMFLDYGADVWAFGCTVLEMLTGQRTWGEHGELEWEEWISVIGGSNLVPYVPEYLSEDAMDFLSKYLERDPDLRWSVDGLINHRFLKWKHEEEEEEEELEVVEDADVEAYEPFEPEEEDDLYDEIGVADIETYEATLLQAGDEFKQE